MGLSEVRVVCIAGVDENPCCGTHVTNLAHLQVRLAVRCTIERNIFMFYVSAAIVFD